MASGRRAEQKCYMYRLLGATWGPCGEAREVGGVKAEGEHQRQAGLSAQFYHEPALPLPSCCEENPNLYFWNKTTYAWSSVVKRAHL